MQAALRAAKDRAGRRADSPAGDGYQDVVEVLRVEEAPPGAVSLHPELLPAVDELRTDDEGPVLDAEVLSVGSDSSTSETEPASGPGPEGRRQDRTAAGYARDWQLWLEYLGRRAAAGPTGQQDSGAAVTPELLTGFVIWLDQVHAAAPATIDRRITGVAAEARRLGVDVLSEATRAARAALRPLRRARARAAQSPDLLRAVVTANPPAADRPGSGRPRSEGAPPLLAQLRDAALHGIRLAVDGGMAALSAMDDRDLVLVESGLRVAVPAARTAPARVEDVAYSDDPEICPVLLWLRWRDAKIDAGAGAEGPAWLAVSKWGHLGGRLGPDAVGRALARSGDRAGLRFSTVPLGRNPREVNALRPSD
nr:site-specific integrase [Kitasatospora purpeofusca]